MTDLNKGVIEVANDNQIKTEQVAGSDVVSTVDGSQQTATVQNIQPTFLGAGVNTSILLQKPINDNQKVSSVKINGMTYTQTQINEAIKHYNLNKMLMHIPPMKFVRTGKISLNASIKKLRYELKLKPYLQAIPKRPGAHPGKGFPAKSVLVEYLYGLNRYENDQIEKLEPEWVEKAIDYAKEHNCPATRALSFRLKKEAEEKERQDKAAQLEETKKQAFADKIAKAQQAVKNKPFDGAIIDLTQRTENDDLTSMTVPLADNALVFIAVFPENMKEGWALINTLGLTYVDEVAWNRDRIRTKSKWSKNCHTNILIATKGQLEDPITSMCLESVHFDHQDQNQMNLPDYYFSVMENLIPGGTFLEKFSYRQFSNQWFSIKGQEVKNA